MRIFIYHANCPDGFGSAWAAWKKFGNKAKYIAAEHHTPPPAGLEGADLCLMDFNYPKDVTEELKKKVVSLTIIDHHVTAKDITESVPNHSYALDHSGAVLTWKYFHPKKPVPKLLLHVEDVDLWKFKLKNTPEIISALYLYKMDFRSWTKLAQDLEKKKTLAKIIEAGKTVMAYKNKLIDEIADKAKVVEFEGYKTLLANSPAAIHSELGNALVNKMPPLGIVYRESDKKIKISLRSNGSVDVSKIAQKYGGGGHKAAAGFVWPLGKQLPWKSIDN